MEILKRGAVKRTVWVGTCWGCDSEVQAERDEVKVTLSQKDGDFATAACPVCQEEMYFYPTVVTENEGPKRLPKGGSGAAPSQKKWREADPPGPTL